MRRDVSFVLGLLFLAVVHGVIPALHQAPNAYPVVSGLGALTMEKPDALDCGNLQPYAADPNHIWNRVHRRLLERRDTKGQVWGCDEVDPLLWQQSKHILASPAYGETVRLLDEFIHTHAEQLIHEPLRRAIFQRDLWAIFDWLARRSHDHLRERAELERRLAAIIRAVALTSSEIERLPDNYAQVRASTARDSLAFPGTAGGWVIIGRDDGTPTAAVHSSAFPRSLFLVYLKLPPGELETSKYMESMRAYSGQRPRTDDCVFHACSPPQFPVGTELALVRRALLIDAVGRPAASPITESVQLRRYVKIPPQTRFDFDGSTQQVAEFQLTRRGLPQGTIGLRRLGEEETGFSVFLTHGEDALEGGRDGNQTGGVTLQRCRGCHQGIGVTSFTSYSRVQFENDHLFVLVHNSTETLETAAAIKFLQTRDAWKRLTWLLHGGG
jgi:hypothetical protein